MDGRIPWGVTLLGLACFVASISFFWGATGAAMYVAMWLEIGGLVLLLGGTIWLAVGSSRKSGELPRGIVAIGVGFLIVLLGLVSMFAISATSPCGDSGACGGSFFPIIAGAVIGCTTMAWGVWDLRAADRPGL